MQKRNRDITIFSLSALDLFCSGMGAIMVVMVLLMPYYLRPPAGEAEELRQQLAQAQAQAQQATAALTAAQQAAEQARASAASAEAQARAIRQQQDASRNKLANPFVALAISWKTEADIDLHVTDPQGRHYWFFKQTNSGSDAKLEVDSQHAGNEVWLNPKAMPGDYRVEYVYYSWKKGPLSDAQPTPVRAVVVYTEGRLEIPEVTMPVPSSWPNGSTRPPDEGLRLKAFSFRVNPNGSVTRL